MSLNVNATPFIPAVNTVTKDLHPCVNCGKTCKGKQCRECHFKMFQSTCIDCEKVFNALRKNGTMRKRCESCQEDYNTKYVKKCPSCNIEFHDISGKYKSCLQCYKDGKEREKEEKKQRFQNKGIKESKEEKECYNRDCKNTTIYKFCKKCNDNKKYLDNTYMLYTCKGCGLKGHGDYSFCKDCN